jgi:hypothetical protein
MQHAQQCEEQRHANSSTEKSLTIFAKEYNIQRKEIFSPLFHNQKFERPIET